MSVARLLRRLRCELTDHDHYRAAQREPKDLGYGRREVNRCRRDCGWQAASR